MITYFLFLSMLVPFIYILYFIKTIETYNDETFTYTISKYKVGKDFPIDVCFQWDDHIFYRDVFKDAVAYINSRLGLSVVNNNILKTPTDKSVLINFYRGKHLPTHPPFDGEGRVLAHAESPPGNRICFDADERWTREKLFITFIHEFFHTLGFKHTKRKTSLMYHLYKVNVDILDNTDVTNFFQLFPFLIMRAK